MRGAEGDDRIDRQALMVGRSDMKGVYEGEERGQMEDGLVDDWKCFACELGLLICDCVYV